MKVDRASLFLIVLITWTITVHLLLTVSRGKVRHVMADFEQLSKEFQNERGEETSEESEGESSGGQSCASARAEITSVRQQVGGELNAINTVLSKIDGVLTQYTKRRQQQQQQVLASRSRGSSDKSTRKKSSERGSVAGHTHVHDLVDTLNVSSSTKKNVPPKERLEEVKLRLSKVLRHSYDVLAFHDAVKHWRRKLQPYIAAMEKRRDRMLYNYI